MVYGYCRISTPKQRIERQVRNIAAEFPEAKMVYEVYTGTKFQNRKEFDKLLGKLKQGDTIVFDSVSRMMLFSTLNDAPFFTLNGAVLA